MTNGKLRRHAPDLKFKLALEALRGERSRTDIAREHGITSSLIWKWEQALLQRGADVFRVAEANAEVIAERDARISDLERLVGQLTLENSVLKKLATRLNSAPPKNGR